MSMVTLKNLLQDKDKNYYGKLAWLLRIAIHPDLVSFPVLSQLELPKETQEEFLKELPWEVGSVFRLEEILDTEFGDYEWDLRHKENTWKLVHFDLGLYEVKGKLICLEYISIDLSEYNDAIVESLEA